MKVEQKGHIAVLKETKGDVNAFAENIVNQYPTYGKLNLILDLTHDSKVTLKDLIIFKDLANKQKKAKKSLVIVVQDIDFDETPSYLVVVPSVLEAHDIIEMDEIERDLGF